MAFSSSTAIGGTGGSGGNGGDIYIVNGAGSQIVTGDEDDLDGGTNSAGILAQSVGGGGGNGGSAASLTVSADAEAPTFSNSVAIGGDGGNGGNGAYVTVVNNGAIITYGENAAGVIVQSVGGGGGNGGDAKSANVAVSETLSVTRTKTVGGTGGKGGKGGNGGGAEYVSQGSVATYGDNSAGVIVQSIGGGGGNGGSAGALTATVSGGISASDTNIIGGDGGDGGKGRSILVKAYAKGTSLPSITTEGENASGLVLQSVGGGGGNGGHSTSLAIAASAEGSITLSTTVGGSGGKGGDGGEIKMVDSGGNIQSLNIRTTGNNSHGILAQSIGGGGGNGGDTLTLSGQISEEGDAYRLSQSLGGSGGDGGDGGLITMQNAGTIVTEGDNSTGVLLQIIGGGGGNGGSSVALAVSSDEGLINADQTLGGNGGDGGDGGLAGTTNVFTNAGSISISGNRSAGILIQSIGGGGGNGGHASSYSLTVSTGGDDEEGDEEEGEEDSPFADELEGQALEAAGLSGSTTLGGSGGSGGSGMTVLAINTGTLSTSGNNSHGIVAQSIGGGGGTAGTVSSFSFDTSEDPSSFVSDRADDARRAVSLSSSQGSQDGANGSGGYATIHSTNHSTTLTTGDLSFALLAQSIGGGGGDAGYVEEAWDGVDEDALIDAWGAVGSDYSFDTLLGTGGSSGNSSTGGRVRGDAKVYVDGDTTVATGGAASQGVVAQAIGNGGGTYSVGLFSSYLTGEDSSFDADFGLGTEVSSSSGHAAYSELVLSASDTVLSTSGDLSNGALIQSIGGGGGLISTVVADGIALDSQSLEYRLGAYTSLKSGENYGSKASADLTDGTISTSGVFSSGIVTQSIGGGGGAGVSQMGDTTGGASDLILSLGRSRGICGSGGLSTITNTSATVVTTGDGSHGLVAQSVGGGGGLAAVTNLDGANVGTSEIYFGTSHSVSGAEGGEATVSNDGTIVTTGDQSYGILAQSVGGGGGIVSLDGGDEVQIHTYETNQTGGFVEVTTGGNSRIATSGDGSHGIFAQSVASGGLLNLLGLTDIDDQTATTSSGYSKYSDSGHGGHVNVESHGRITATGDHSHGILAISTAGSSVVSLTSTGIEILGNHGLANSGKASVYQHGTINVSGEGASGVYVITNNWKIENTAYISASGTVIASGEDGSALRIRNAARNAESGSGGEETYQTSRVRVGRDARIIAKDSSTATSAIYVADDHGRTQLDIFGKVAAVETDGTAAQTYDALQRAIKVSGYATITAYRGSSVVGTIEALESDKVDIVNFGELDGSTINIRTYNSESGSRHYLEINPIDDAGALVQAKSFGTLNGTFNPYLSAFGTLASDVTVLDFEETLSASVLESVVNTPVLTFDKELQDNGHEVAITQVSADFLDAGLTGNSLTVAERVDPLVQAWMGGGDVNDQDLYDFLLYAANQPTLDELEEAITTHLDASQHYGLSTSQHGNGVSHLDNLHSCGTEYGDYAAIREDECSWLKAVHKYTEDFSSGRDGTTSGISLGRQIAIADHWRFGLGANINFSDFGNALIDSSGTSYYAGGVLKYTNGPWLATAALSGAYTLMDNARVVPSGDVARSSQHGAGVSSRFRLGYEVELGSTFFMPLVDLDTSWIHDFGYRETGGGAFNIQVLEDDRFFFDIHPRVRVGTELRGGDGVLFRPFLEAGLRFALNDEDLEQRFTSPFLAGNTLKMDIDREDMKATLGVGFQAFLGHRAEAKLRYDGSFGQESRSHAFSLKVGMKF